MASGGIDPTLLDKFEGEYQRVAGKKKPYENKLAAASQFLEETFRATLPPPAPPMTNLDYGLPPAQGPAGATITSFKELHDMMLRHVPPKYGELAVAVVSNALVVVERAREGSNSTERNFIPSPYPLPFPSHTHTLMMQHPPSVSSRP
jgi:hypothetical protein